MERNRTMGLAVAILSLLTTCCLCPLGINALGNLLNFIRNVPTPGLYARLLGRINPRLIGPLLNLQIIFAGILVLIIAILSFVTYFSVKEPGPEAHIDTE